MRLVHGNRQINLKVSRTIARTFATLVIAASAAKSQVVQAADAQLAALSAAFHANIPASWQAQDGQWQYADIVKCYTQGPSCFGNNPTTPYGMPVFPGSDPGAMVSNFNMGESDAVVIILRTPSSSRYFAFTPYLFSKGTDPAGSPPVFASLEDSLNLMRMGTTGSAQVGQNPFDQYAAVVFTPNLEMFRRTRDLLMNAGLPQQAVNLMGLPKYLPVDTLRLGDGVGTDTFGILMRVALPDVPANFQAYMAEKPFVIVKLRPDAIPMDQAPAVPYASEISGVGEPLTLTLAINQLASDIKARYVNEFGFQSQNINYAEKTGWDCIAGDAMCNGDNHDARYSLDTPKPVLVKNLKDVVLVVGVNHQKTGKALYINHSVYDTKRMAGIVAVADPSLTTDSALYHAGITDPKDRRRLTYKNLYAYMISYDCSGKSYCLSIPAPTPENPVGLNPGAPFLVVGRAYVDPLTGVRPSLDEIVTHQVLIGSKK